MSVADSLINRRRLRRYKLTADIAILDSLRSEPLGKLVDIHQQGLLMLGQSFAIASSHQLSLMLPNSINGQIHIEIGVECLWCQPCVDNNTLFWGGFMIIDKSKNATDGIQSLINITSK
jgi:hypothetical protein